MKLINYFYILFFLLVLQGTSGACDIAQYLNDIGQHTHFRNHMNSLPQGQLEKHFKAYQKVYAQIPTSSHLHALDKDVLDQLVSMMEPGSLFRIKRPTTWSTELDDIIKTAAQSPCVTCGNAGQLGMSKMDDLLKNVEYLVDNFDVDIHAGAKKFYLWLQNKTIGGSGTPTSLQLDEAHQTLEVIKRDNLGNSTNLGGDFPDPPVGGGAKKQFDLKYNDFYHELKNKAFTTSTGIDADDVDQLIKGYFRNASAIENIKWEVRYEKSKASFANADALKTHLKDKMKVAFTNLGANSIYMEMSAAVRSSLMINDADDLLPFINDSSSLLYDFIKVDGI